MKDFEYKGFRILYLPSLECRRLRGDTIETFKRAYGFYDDKAAQSRFKLSNAISTINVNVPLNPPLNVNLNPPH